MSRFVFSFSLEKFLYRKFNLLFEFSMFSPFVCHFFIIFFELLTFYIHESKRFLFSYFWNRNDAKNFHLLFVIFPASSSFSILLRFSLRGIRIKFLFLSLVERRRREMGKAWESIQKKKKKKKGDAGTMKKKKRRRTRAEKEGVGEEEALQHMRGLSTTHTHPFVHFFLFLCFRSWHL